MADQVQSSRPRVALIFGDAAAVKHLRDAVAEQVDVVYDVQANEFDVKRLSELHVAAALINLDSFEWLDTIGAQLNRAGVLVVFNDPEISSQLDGWEHARWLRHLVAKLRHSDDYDPPRPAFGVAAPASETMAEAPETAAAPVQVQPEVVATPEPEVVSVVAEPQPEVIATPEPVMAPAVTQPALVATSEPMPAPMLAQAPETDPGVAARPLSAQEIESMTVDFSAAPEPAAAVAPAAAQDAVESDALDVDTEALSAMIDARLAESEQHVSEPPGVWSVDAGNQEAAVDQADQVAARAGEAAAAAVAEAAPAAVAPADDSDVLADLPALDDWQLLDPDLPVAPVAASKRVEPAEPAAANDLSGLELVPMDAGTPIELHSEPVEHRLYVERRKQAAGDAAAAADSNGEHA